ncbi:dTMP kinase [Lacicoccus qingdaonensis]|uniref:Thymidylate kinase n=1 Tax=Lacicoccus qingdaonensis TaxID=576118 RepID=A0A1G9GF46_9BACL|nr:dTMP kinase [Salinicoccus qingdaonensis]SDK99294.1 thymidylate kinase [Salinicoccus qingdaonensis]
MTIFITFEGPEGSGKTTIISMLSEALEDTNDVMVTREPGGIPISEKVRDILLANENDMDGRTEALLFAAARRQHLVEKVVPALNDGKIVLCDRFIDSSLAYQGYARNLGMDEIMQVNKFAIENHMPDLTIYLKLSPEIGLSRIQDNERDSNRLDKETLEFHKDVVLGYNKLSENYPDRIKVVDADQNIEDVFKDTYSIIEKYMNHRGDKS